MDEELLALLRGALGNVRAAVDPRTPGFFDRGVPGLIKSTVQGMQRDPLGIETYRAGNQAASEGHPVLGGVLQGAGLMGMVPGGPDDILARLPRPKPSTEMLRLRHYGREVENLDVLDPAFQGTGLPGAETQRFNAFPGEAPPRIHYYIEDTAPERQFAHLPMVEVEVPKGSMLPAEETGPFYEAAQEMLRAEGRTPVPALVASRAERLMPAVGWDGYTTASGVGVRFTPTPLERRRAADIAEIGKPAAPETIKSAAIRLPDGSIIEGTLHGSIYSDMTDAQRAAYEALSGEELMRSEGFVTSTGRYVDREEAAEIADRASQIPTERSRGELHSRAVAESQGKLDEILQSGYKDPRPASLLMKPRTYMPRTPEDIDASIADAARKAAEQGVVEQARSLATRGDVPDVLPALRRLLDEIEAPAVITRPSGIFDTSPQALERSFIEGVPQEPVEYLPVAQGFRRDAIRRRFTPELRRGLIDLADRMREQYPAAPSWYATGPLRQFAVDELGEEAGAAGFDQFMRRVAATSPRTKVYPNVVYGSQNTHKMGMVRDLLARTNAGLPFGPTAPKISSFYPNLTGNLRPTTIDTHMTSVLGGPGPDKDLYGEYDRLLARTAGEAGMAPAQLQSTLWHAGQTLKDPAVFLEQVNRAAAAAGKRQGVTNEEALRRFFRGEGTLGAFAPFLLAGPMGLGLSQRSER